jgi:hypothetical protein
LKLQKVALQTAAIKGRDVAHNMVFVGWIRIDINDLTHYRCVPFDAIVAALRLCFATLYRFASRRFTGLLRKLGNFSFGSSFPARLFRLGVP